jgi:hypothetical protein
MIESNCVRVCKRERERERERVRSRLFYFSGTIDGSHTVDKRDEHCTCTVVFLYFSLNIDLARRKQDTSKSMQSSTMLACTSDSHTCVHCLA